MLVSISGRRTLVEPLVVFAMCQTISHTGTVAALSYKSLLITFTIVVPVRAESVKDATFS